MDDKKNLGRISIETKDVSELKPAEYNPRSMNDKARQGLSNSIDTFGLVQPVIWNKQTGNVVGGHQRLYDLITKGVETTDFIVVDLSMIKEKALNIALNNTAISGEFTDTLQDLLEELDDEIKKDLMLDHLEIPEFEPMNEDEFGDDMKQKPYVIKVTVIDHILYDSVMEQLKSFTHSSWGDSVKVES